jgi:N-acetylglucosaminyldiphosphoundecaprenol N-acetyl-beta-D-mannosaminyltransferase
MAVKRIEILGVPVDCVTMAGAVAEAEALILRGDRPAAVLAVNPEKVIKAQDDPVLLNTLRGAGLLIPDGIGVVLAAKLLRLGTMERVPGSELMPALCELAARKGYRVFVFGASREVNEKAVAEIERRYPGIQIAGRQHGYIKDEDMAGLVSAINGSQAQILFVALGSPRQELWMGEHLPRLEAVRVCQGVGVLAGHVKRAPAFFRRVHLEWLYRLLSQPRRLLRQTALPKFAWQVAVAALRR